MKNGDLVPDTNGFIEKNQTSEALLKVGIHHRIARETVDANFLSASCGTCPLTMDVFNMNTIRTRFGVSPVGGPHEHFRSTGIRDGDQPFRGAFNFGERCLRGAQRWLIDEIQCFANLWDREVGFPPSNDVDTSKYPPGCTEEDSGPQKCPSQLHGAIGFLFQSFGTPPNQASSPDGVATSISRADYRALWLDAEYPSEFAARSPRHCRTESVEPPQFGCQACLEQIESATQSTIERYCLCIASRQLSASVLSSLAEYQSLCIFEAGRQIGTGALEGLNISHLILQWSFTVECQPFCNPLGSFTTGFDLPGPPSVPPGAPSLPPAPVGTQQFVVTVVLESPLDISEFTEQTINDIAAAFADAAGVDPDRVTVVVRVARCVSRRQLQSSSSSGTSIEVSINAGEESSAADDIAADLTMRMSEEFMNNASVFGIAVSEFPALEVSTITIERSPDSSADPTMAASTDPVLFGLIFGTSLAILVGILLLCLVRRYRRLKRSAKRNMTTMALSSQREEQQIRVKPAALPPPAAPGESSPNIRQPTRRQDTFAEDARASLSEYHGGASSEAPGRLSSTRPSATNAAAASDTKTGLRQQVQMLREHLKFPADTPLREVVERANAVYRLPNEGRIVAQLVRLMDEIEADKLRSTEVLEDSHRNEAGGEQDEEEGPFEGELTA